MRRTLTPALSLEGEGEEAELGLGEPGREKDALMDELILIGLDWAKRSLLSEAGFGTLDSLRAAKDETLAAVPGIGEGTVRTIRRAIRHMDGDYREARDG